MKQKIDFGQWSHAAAEWSTQYLDTVANRPVRSANAPGDVTKEIAAVPPESAETMETIFADFERIIPNGMTHWQHPRFFAYFPSNAAPAAIVAEQLAAAMSAQCMLWQTSPAATELESTMVSWLRQSLGLPDDFSGVLQDTASSATLCAVLNMRERALDWKGNVQGLSGLPRVRVYASTRTHSSIDKALWVAGLGQDNLVKIPTNEHFQMDLTALSAAIKADREAGFLPGGIVACVGGTSMGATDDVKQVCAIAKTEDLFVHVDAAWAGSAMICPEFRELWDGAELADSIVVNPHKWLGAPMECSAHFVRDPAMLQRTLSITPEYLKTRDHDDIVNFSEWSVQLGRRFRALKVWFLFRAYGLEGLREMIRNHVQWSVKLAHRLEAETDFEVVTQPILSLFTFRYKPTTDADLDELNLALLQRINDDGRIYLTQTDHNSQKVIRFVTGQFDMEESDVDIAYDVITSIARTMKSNK